MRSSGRDHGFAGRWSNLLFGSVARRVTIGAQWGTRLLQRCTAYPVMLLNVVLCEKGPRLITTGMLGVLCWAEGESPWEESFGARCHGGQRQGGHRARTSRFARRRNVRAFRPLSDSHPDGGHSRVAVSLRADPSWACSERNDPKPSTLVAKGEGEAPYGHRLRSTMPATYPFRDQPRQSVTTKTDKLPAETVTAEKADSGDLGLRDHDVPIQRWAEEVAVASAALELRQHAEDSPEQLIVVLRLRHRTIDPSREFAVP